MGHVTASLLDHFGVQTEIEQRIGAFLLYALCQELASDLRPADNGLLFDSGVMLSEPLD